MIKYRLLPMVALALISNYGLAQRGLRVKTGNNVCIMNARFTELLDRNAAPTRILAIQQAVFTAYSGLKVNKSI